VGSQLLSTASGIQFEKPLEMSLPSAWFIGCYYTVSSLVNKAFVVSEWLGLNISCEKIFVVFSGRRNH